MCRSLPWFPGEGSKSPCKSFGILFEATAVCFVEYVAELCVEEILLLWPRPCGVRGKNIN